VKLIIGAQGKYRLVLIERMSVTRRKYHLWQGDVSIEKNSPPIIRHLRVEPISYNNLKSAGIEKGMATF